jgi:hypothetical protein
MGLPTPTISLSLQKRIEEFAFKQNLVNSTFGEGLTMFYNPLTADIELCCEGELVFRFISGRTVYFRSDNWINHFD